MADIRTERQKLVSLEAGWPYRKYGLTYLTDIHRTGKELGRGQSSVVEEVVYNGEVCAMKVPATFHMKYTLLEEAKILASLKHPHIMKLIGVTAIEHDEQMSLVLEKGTTTLRHFLSSFQKEVVPLQLKVQILEQVSEAVHYLHSQESPIVHGDITGTNIFLTDQYQVKLGDFGSACSDNDVWELAYSKDELWRYNYSTEGECTLKM